jgi:hypothetical protein
MKRAFFLSTVCAIALLIGIPPSTATANEDDTSVRVESAGKDGNLPNHAVQVESGDYDAGNARRPPDRLSDLMTPLPVIAALAAVVLAAGLAVGMRRRRN